MQSKEKDSAISNKIFSFWGLTNFLCRSLLGFKLWSSNTKEGGSQTRRKWGTKTHYILPKKIHLVQWKWGGVFIPLTLRYMVPEIFEWYSGLMDTSRSLSVKLSTPTRSHFSCAPEGNLWLRVHVLRLSSSSSRLEELHAPSEVTTQFLCPFNGLPRTFDRHAGDPHAPSSPII